MTEHITLIHACPTIPLSVNTNVAAWVFSEVPFWNSAGETEFYTELTLFRVIPRNSAEFFTVQCCEIPRNSA